MSLPVLEDGFLLFLFSLFNVAFASTVIYFLVSDRMPGIFSDIVSFPNVKTDTCNTYLATRSIVAKYAPACVNMTQ